MFDQLLVCVQYHTYELIGREEEDELIQVRNSLTLLTSRCNLTTNGIPQETLAGWMRTIDVLFNTIMVLKPFSPTKVIFIGC